MNNFLALPEEKQKKVIDAALLVFGNVGYRKASTNDIATEAGISKGMIFHYFGRKKQMYLYLIQYSMESVVGAFMQNCGEDITDFFDRMALGTKIKLDLLKKHPALFKFMISMCMESDKEVLAEISEIIKMSEGMGRELALSKMDREKFKEGIEPEKVVTILTKYNEGYLYRVEKDCNIDEMVKEMNECMLLMKNNFYKPEYL